MTKFSPDFGRTIKGKISLLLPHLTVLTALSAKISPKQNWRELYEASLLRIVLNFRSESEPPAKLFIGA